MITEILKATAVLLVMINPMAKILVVLALAEGRKRHDTQGLVLKSNAVAICVIFTFTIFGTFILAEILNIGIDALRVAGGFALFVIGFDYLWRGELRILTQIERLEEIAVAPVGTP